MLNQNQIDKGELAICELNEDEIQYVSGGIIPFIIAAAGAAAGGYAAGYVAGRAVAYFKKSQAEN